jgi:hypothetical protein
MHAEIWPYASIMCSRRELVDMSMIVLQTLGPSKMTGVLTIAWCGLTEAARGLLTAALRWNAETSVPRDLHQDVIWKVLRLPRACPS